MDPKASDEPRTASEEAAKIAFELVKGRLDRQAVRLAEIRTNSSVLLAATALIASFLGGTSIDRNGLSAANWVALMFLVAGVLVGIRPLWPVRDPSATSIPKRTLEAVPLFGERLVKLSGVDLVWQGSLSVAEVLALDQDGEAHPRLAVAEGLSRNLRSNQAIINRRSRWVMATSLFLFGQVIAWSVGLAT